ncbi:hypothetical protein BAUCODRAFT_30132 [Baudoinia panamericana UAMH 10762]|uniref:Uncharacterized protein n=1 Tax=Baudoinia panamericana (strain UAMH 10762) TaxID=717646 RepID=M2LYE8_BAUPA|nr:uncharacterized protein BAUCODRAFT_30132 [Baudoinia panamericana UAMH 10762]EMC99737.1 hypothetical protein BAUCODRAFT_30132 [Baudoinia panamericana UAMH 10762]
MGRQAAATAAHAQGVQHAEDERKHHTRNRSHEGDTEIRLPGSLDEQDRPPIRRNMTAYELPRNRSGTKLKKNFSHGQLTRLQSGKNLAGMTSSHQKPPPSPGLKGKKSKRKSVELDLHEQEVELLRQQQEQKANAAPKRVGFAVGSAEETSDDNAAPQMDGSGMQEDEWTEESASASPYSTRQHSRRTSVVVDKPPDEPSTRKPQHPSVSLHTTETTQPREAVEEVQQSRPEADRTPAASEEDTDESDVISPHTLEPSQMRELVLPHEPLPPSLQPEPQSTMQPKSQTRSPVHAAKDHPNPTVQRLTSAQLPAPALVSSISALDDVHSSRGSPAPSLRSSRSIVGQDGAHDQPSEESELVSRFLPSASHPSTGSGSNTAAMSTPKTGSFQSNNMPEREPAAEGVRSTDTSYHAGPVSPGSTISGSSGAATPALGRSRIELRMMHDKALADREAAAERQPLVPHHIYDRRNETLKSYLNLAALGGDGRGGLNAHTGLSLGPEIFQGRFKAVNTELKVVQKFRDPIAESLERLQKCRGPRLFQKQSPQKQLQQQHTALKQSKSAITLPSRSRPSRETSKLSTSASPPKFVPQSGPQAKSASPQKPADPSSSTGSVRVQTTIEQSSRPSSQRKPGKRGVSFAGVESDPKRDSTEEQTEQRKDQSNVDEHLSPDMIARRLWESV